MISGEFIGMAFGRGLDQTVDITHLDDIHDHQERNLLEASLSRANSKRIGLVQLSNSMSDSAESELIIKKKRFLRLKSRDILIDVLPSLYLMLSSITTIFISSEFLTALAKNITQGGLHKRKFQIMYFPDYIASLSPVTQILFLASQLVYLTITMTLYRLVKQRISVPELISQKFKNLVFLISSISSSTTLMLIALCKVKSKDVFLSVLGFCSNPMYLISMTCGILTVTMSFDLLVRIGGEDFTRFNIKVVCIKRGIVFFMLMQYTLYCLSLLMVSYYNPVIQIEKVMMGVLVVCLDVNSYLLWVSLQFYVFMIKFDIYYINMNLLIRPDLEYFLDVENIDN